ncbi:hypothetical protein R69608_07031 [Paraburkholderia nemoris]|uniref:HNH endonuclease n=1 Tax=Paraburkholderia nemoris TaxID=2793076 RepID=UPI0019115406|nr:HNH endonuclease [Paraburkholderia nemoris]MBK5152459.1 HNH endonuclease [Burkholderia sp. R-69608]CAE6967666.1 hypothetical protein R69608_07031 [Paraburkholderia nemoris]
METCYFCEKPFDGVEVKRHDEHIIPNAIGGKLKSSEFLCEYCGGKLSVSIDSSFNEYLQVFSVLHGVERDRGESKKAAVEVISRVTPMGGKRSVTFSLNSDFTITPDRPIYFVDEDERLATICCSIPKQVHAFMQSAEIRKLRDDGYRVVVASDMAQFVVQSALRVDLESIEVLRGLAKIAIEYALHCGVSIEDLADFRDRFIKLCDDTKLRGAVTQYYPTTDEEKLYETGKFHHEDWYPNHQLFLFSSGRNLYCYVELFGAVQKYVHLSSTYSGDLGVEKYLQKITSWNFDPAAWHGGPKDLHIMAGQFDVSFEGRTLEEVQKDVLHMAQTRPYELDSDAQLEKVETLVHTLINYAISDIKGFDVVDDLLRKAAEAKSGLGFMLVDRLKQDPLQGMRWIYKDFSSFRIQSGADSCPVVAATISPESLQHYAAFRLYETLCSIGRENQIDFLLENS